MTVADLAPTDATMTTTANLKRCWNCAFYSFKVYAGEDDTQGKCFRDFKDNRKIHWVDGLMTCPQWAPDRTVKGENRC